MRICMIVNNMGTFGGLQEFVKNLAIGIQDYGHEVSVFSACWDPEDNQYIRSLRENKVTFIQIPKWVSIPAEQWPAKRRIDNIAMWLAFPLMVVLSLFVAVIRRRSLGKSLVSARNWLNGQIVSRFEPSSRQPFVRLYLEWWRRRWRPDLIHIHGYTTDLLYVIDWAHSKNIPVVYEEHQTPDPQFNWWQGFEKTINKSAVVIGVSEKSAQGLREVCGVTQPIEVAYCMVPDPVAAGWKETPRPRDGSRPIRVTNIARLYVTKGLNYLLDAIKLVRAAHPDAEFRVYGDGDLHDELMAYAEKLGLNGKEIFVGAYTSRAELDRIMDQTDIFVLSSILEGLPISLLEAMSYGVPVVITPAGGSAEAVQDGVNGLICPPRDPECLAQKICTLIENPELRAAFGRAARKSFEEGPFYPTTVYNRFIGIYQNVLDQSKPKA